MRLIKLRYWHGFRCRDPLDHAAPGRAGPGFGRARPGGRRLPGAVPHFLPGGRIFDIETNGAYTNARRHGLRGMGVHGPASRRRRGPRGLAGCGCQPGLGRAGGVRPKATCTKSGIISCSIDIVTISKMQASRTRSGLSICARTAFAFASTTIAGRTSSWPHRNIERPA